ncbi:MAG: DUF4058 family protein [Caldilineaceae bacterium]|nr:DUF4058 family protein [Caldilineaceae bacterium]
MSQQQTTQQSPFPGMDPFLEEPARWSSVHTRLINAISDQLAERVSPNFYVEIEERIVVAATDPNETDLYFEPDVYLTRGQEYASQQAYATVITPPTVVEVIHPEEIRQRYLEVRDSFNHEVITTIELLSPFNKAGGKRGHVDFLKKRRQMMTTNVHWLEIDLLRAGLRPPEVTGKSDYYALLKRGGVLDVFEVWYIDLRNSLPTIAVPLRAGLDDVPLDLQSAFADMYRRAYYGDSIDYTAAVPAPPLSAVDENWIREQIALCSTN